jgi:hypothetical protein
MECKVAGSNLVFVEAHGARIYLKGEVEVRELVKKLTNSLFELSSLSRKGVENGIEERSNSQLSFWGVFKVR